jgi:flagellar biosynthesis component FlhA
LQLLAGTTRALVAERLPIVDASAVLAVLDRLSPGTGLAAAVAAVRLELARLLPGRRGVPAWWRLPEALEEALQEALVPGAGDHRLIVDAALQRQVLEAVRDDGWATSPLVVRSSELRPFVRALLVREFPDLNVVTEAELLLDTAEPLAVTS